MRSTLDHPLSYERRPPLGNSLIDSEPGMVFIRILPDRTLGRAISAVFLSLACGVLIFTLSGMTWTRVGIFRSVPPLSAGVLLLAAGLTLRYCARGGVTSIVATSEGIEFSAGGFDARRIERSQVARVFTRDTPLSKQLSLGLRLRDGAEIVLGVGTKKEIDAMAKALHGLLNA